MKYLRVFSFVYSTSIFEFWIRSVTNIEMFAILTAEEKLDTGYVRFHFCALNLLESSQWPHHWPSTDLDCVEIVRTRVSGSIVFGLESAKKANKNSQKLSFIASGRRRYRFKSCHSDQKWGLVSQRSSPFFHFSSDSRLRCLPSANRLLFRLRRMFHSD